MVPRLCSPILPADSQLVAHLTPRLAIQFPANAVESLVIGEPPTVLPLTRRRPQVRIRPFPLRVFVTPTRRKPVPSSRETTQCSQEAR